MKRADCESLSKDHSLWYGWVVLIVIFIVMSVMVGIRNSIGFFFKSIAGEFGWNRAQTAGAYSIGMVVQGICSPLFGRAGERWSLRWMISLGIFFGGAALLIGTFIQSLPSFYLMYALLNIGFAASTFVPQVQILSNWFSKRRGLAMGISNSGRICSGFDSGSSLPYPASRMASQLSGPGGIYPSFRISTSSPPVKGSSRRPRDNGGRPFLAPLERSALMGVQSAGHQAKNVKRLEPPFRIVFFSLPFFLIAFTYGAIAFIMVGTTVHLIPHATDQGFTPNTSAFIFLLWGICLISGNLLSIISDYMGRTRTYVIGTALGAGGCVVFAFFIHGMPETLFYLATATSGLGLGLTRPTASALLADHFAGPGFGKLNGSVMTIFSLCGALGAFLTGYVFDISGSYKSAFLLLAAVNTAGAGAVVFLGRITAAGR